MPETVFMPSDISKPNLDWIFLNRVQALDIEKYINDVCIYFIWINVENSEKENDTIKK